MRPPAEGRRHGDLRLAPAGCTPGRLEIRSTSLPRGRGSQGRGHSGPTSNYVTGEVPLRPVGRRGAPEQRAFLRSCSLQKLGASDPRHPWSISRGPRTVAVAEPRLGTSVPSAQRRSSRRLGDAPERGASERADGPSAGRYLLAIRPVDTQGRGHGWTVQPFRARARMYALALFGPTRLPGSRLPRI